MKMYLIAVCILLSCSVIPAMTRCEYRKYLLPEETYYVYSPGYPTNFTSGVFCRWIVNSPPGYVCRLNCSEIVLNESPSCSSDRLLVANNGDPLLLMANFYCGRRSITEVSLGRRMSIRLQASSNTTGGRFFCEATAEKENLFYPPALAGRENNLSTEQPWLKVWINAINEITSQINFYKKQATRWLQ